MTSILIDHVNQGWLKGENSRTPLETKILENPYS